MVEVITVPYFDKRLFLPSVIQLLLIFTPMSLNLVNQSIIYWEVIWYYMLLFREIDVTTIA